MALSWNQPISGICPAFVFPSKSNSKTLGRALRGRVPRVSECERRSLRSVLHDSLALSSAGSVHFRALNQHLNLVLLLVVGIGFQ